MNVKHYVNRTKGVLDEINQAYEERERELEECRQEVRRLAKANTDLLVQVNATRLENVSIKADLEGFRADYAALEQRLADLEGSRGAVGRDYRPGRDAVPSGGVVTDLPGTLPTAVGGTE